MDQWPCFSPSDKSGADEITQILCRHRRESLAVFRARLTVFDRFRRFFLPIGKRRRARKALKRRVFPQARPRRKPSQLAENSARNGRGSCIFVRLECGLDDSIDPLAVSRRTRSLADGARQPNSRNYRPSAELRPATIVQNGNL